VKSVLLKGGIEVGSIASGASRGSGGKGSYPWPINPTGTTGSDYKVSVQNIRQPTINDVSTNYFTPMLKRGKVKMLDQLKNK
jgi:hypothetical protein